MRRRVSLASAALTKKNGVGIEPCTLARERPDEHARKLALTPAQASICYQRAPAGVRCDADSLRDQKGGAIPFLMSVELYPLPGDQAGGLANTLRRCESICYQEKWVNYRVERRKLVSIFHRSIAPGRLATLPDHKVRARHRVTDRMGLTA